MSATRIRVIFPAGAALDAYTGVASHAQLTDRTTEMPLNFTELDATTRAIMRREFDTEQSDAGRYLPTSLNAVGLAAWPGLMRAAVDSGDDATLRDSLLQNPSFFYTSIATKKGPRLVNFDQAATRLATSEFNTLYVRGLAARLLGEEIEFVQVYRAAPATFTVASCARHEGAIARAEDVYEGHRADYHPAGGRQAVISIPFQPGCHHSIQRVPDSSPTPDSNDAPVADGN